MILPHISTDLALAPPLEGLLHNSIHLQISLLKCLARQINYFSVPCGLDLSSAVVWWSYACGGMGQAWGQFHRVWSELNIWNAKWFNYLMFYFNIFDAWWVIELFLFPRFNLTTHGSAWFRWMKFHFLSAILFSLLRIPLVVFLLILAGRDYRCCKRKSCLWIYGCYSVRELTSNLAVVHQVSYLYAWFILFLRVIVLFLRVSSQ